MCGGGKPQTTHVCTCFCCVHYEPHLSNASHSPAEADIEDIWTYHVHLNVVQADPFTYPIQKRCLWLPNSPDVEVVRILHGCRDIESLFRE